MPIDSNDALKGANPNYALGQEYKKLPKVCPGVRAAKAWLRCSSEADAADRQYDEKEH